MSRKRNHFERLSRKRHASHKFKNPYFKPSKAYKWKLGFLIITPIVLLIALAIFLLTSERFVLNQIDISGTVTIPQNEISDILTDYIDESVYLVFNRSNQWLFDEENAKKRLEEKFAFESLIFERQANKLIVTIKEKTSSLLWQTGQGIYLVDLKGTAIRLLTDAEKDVLNTPLAEPAEEEVATAADPLTLLPRFRDLNNIEIDPGESVLSAEEVINIFRFHEHLVAQQIENSETKIDRLSGKWMSVETILGYEILFDPSGDIDAQAANLETILRKSIPDQSELQYIDLRFGDHVYFK